jgi:hypothetical protein
MLPYADNGLTWKPADFINTSPQTS